MRTIYFVERFWPLIGGVEVVSARLVPMLAELGHDIVLVTDDDDGSLPERERYQQVPVVRLPFTRAITTRNLELLAVARRGINAVLREHRPELIHATFTGAGIWLLPPGDTTPMIVSFHGGWPTIDFAQADGLFVRLLRRAAWVTACSEHALSFLLAQAPHLAGRSSVIANGLAPRVPDEPANPPPGPPILFCSGRIVEDKGFDVAIDAFAQLVRARPDARLVIAGDGPERTALAERAASLGLTGQVELPGWVSPGGVHEFVRRASVVLVPSRLEGFGLVALEAALMARPVIASDVGGLPEVVEDGHTGILVPVDDVPALAAAIERLLVDPVSASRMGSVGRKRALERFSARRHADDWDALYRRIGASDRSAICL